MNYAEKKEFLEHAKELARNLEEKTDKEIEIQIGWMDMWQPNECEHPLTICLNKDFWFGDFENMGYNESVIWDNLNKFVPFTEDYLVFNELINKVYEIEEKDN